MPLTRRRSLQVAAAWLLASALPCLPAARAQEAGDRYPTANGEIVVMPIKEASLILQVPGLVIYCDPAGGGQLFENRPAPGLILICHEHVDHMDVSTLRDIVTVRASSPRRSSVRSEPIASSIRPTHLNRREHDPI